MKAALCAALFGALLAVSIACPEKPYHSCVKEEKPPKCTAIEVCEYPHKEPCGHDYCEYPSVCATLKKEECYGFLALKEKCGKPKKVCKEIMKPCGYGACGAHQDCVKETVCKIKKVGYGRKLMEYGGDKSVAVANSKALALGDGVAVADATAVAKGGYAIANSEAIAVGGGYYDDDGKYYPHYYDKCDKKCEKEKLVCEEKFTCVAKEPCVDITVKKCVKSEYKEGIDVCHGGYDFLFYALNEGEICGDEYCGYGYKCAEVTIQKCKTKCGDYECDSGYECATEYEDPECDKYVYLETICKDVYEPVCVKLPPFIVAKYKPPCKTIFKCEVEECVCGNKYCPYGFVCAVDYKKSCGGSYKPYIAGKVVEKPYKKPDAKYEYPVEVPKKEEPSKDAAKAEILLKADEENTLALGKGTSSGDATTGFDGKAANKDGSASAVKGYGGPDGAAVAALANQKTGGKSVAGGHIESGP